MPESGYVLAGFEALRLILLNFMAGKRGRWNDNFTKDQVADFFTNKISGLLHSYGQNFAGKKLYHKYNAAETKVYQQCKDSGLFGDCPMIADSGGFQISNGRLSRHEADMLLTMYYDWIEEYPDIIERAFILDVPPGAGCRVFNNFNDVYKLNLQSYIRAKEMDDEIRKKIIYVHHFRTPKLWEIYTKIMRDNDMFPAFEHHGTGGIVANMASDMAVPCIMYILPIIPLINEAKKWGRDYLNFHILGGAHYRDMFFYELIKYAVWKEHKFTINLSYDSSGIFKQVMFARYMYTMDGNGFMKKMDIRSFNLENRFYDRPVQGEAHTVEGMMQDTINQLADDNGWKRISMDGVYDPARGTLHEDVKVYAMFRILANYEIFEKTLKKKVEELYPYYEAGEKEEFYNHCDQIILNLNAGKTTKKQAAKSTAIFNSLEMLRNLDEDKCKNVVDMLLQKDEFIDLTRKKVIEI